MKISSDHTSHSLNILFVFFVLLGCHEPKAKEDTTAAKNTSMANHSTGLDDNEGRSFHYDKYEEIKHVDFRDYYISLQKGSDFRDTSRDRNELYAHNNIIIVRSKKTTRSDTLALETYDDIDDCTITDLSDSLRMALCVEIGWSGDSDMPTTEYVAIWKDSLRTLFTLTNVTSLRRADDITLTGFVSSRDEVVSGFQPDYPITISLKDMTINEEKPAIQQIDYFTHTIANLKGQRMTRSGAFIPYIVRKNTDVLVDSIYRREGLVRLIIRDSIIFYAPIDSAHEKLQGDTAG